MNCRGTARRPPTWSRASFVDDGKALVTIKRGAFRGPPHPTRAPRESAVAGHPLPQGGEGCYF